MVSCISAQYCMDSTVKHQASCSLFTECNLMNIPFINKPSWMETNIFSWQCFLFYFIILISNKFFSIFWDQVALAESQYCTESEWNINCKRKCQTQVASTEHLFKSISARWKHDAAHKARNCNVSNIRADLIVHAGLELCWLFMRVWLSPRLEKCTWD